MPISSFALITTGFFTRTSPTNGFFSTAVFVTYTLQPSFFVSALCLTHTSHPHACSSDVSGMSNRRNTGSRISGVDSPFISASSSSRFATSLSEFASTSSRITPLSNARRRSENAVSDTADTTLFALSYGSNPASTPTPEISSIPAANRPVPTHSPASPFSSFTSTTRPLYR